MSHSSRSQSARLQSAGSRSADSKSNDIVVFSLVNTKKSDYDDLLMGGMERSDARLSVRGQIDEVLERWGRR